MESFHFCDLVTELAEKYQKLKQFFKFQDGFPIFNNNFILKKWNLKRSLTESYWHARFRTVKLYLNYITTYLKYISSDLQESSRSTVKISFKID